MFWSGFLVRQLFEVGVQKKDNTMFFFSAHSEKRMSNYSLFKTLIQGKTLHTFIMSKDRNVGKSVKFFFDSFSESLQIDKECAEARWFCKHTVGVSIFAGSSVSYKYKAFFISSPATCEDRRNIPYERSSAPEHKRRLCPILWILGEGPMRFFRGWLLSDWD